MRLSLGAGVHLALHSQPGAERTVTVRRIASTGACPVRALTRLRGLGVLSILRPLPINGLDGKVCTIGVGWGRWL
jgi:hypothetical protein